VAALLAVPRLAMAVAVPAAVLVAVPAVTIVA
jgi:hypothetical protein